MSMYGWHGSDLICCNCGDSWGEEGRYERPFERGWRKRASAAAKRLWLRAGTRAAASLRLTATRARKTRLQKVRRWNDGLG